jgi:hypothetical protein
MGQDLGGEWMGRRGERCLGGRVSAMDHGQGKSECVLL